MFKKSRIISLRLEENIYQLIKEIAALESTYSGKKVTEQTLCRNALSFCYEDGERLREVFRRAKQIMSKKLHQKDTMG